MKIKKRAILVNNKKRIIRKHILYNIKTKSSLYYNFYLASMLLLYATIIISFWHFIFSFKSINKNIYNNGVNTIDLYGYVIYSPMKICIILLSLFNVYFFISNEIKFNLLINFKNLRKFNVGLGNLLTILVSFVIFVLTLICLQFYYAKM